VLNAFNGTRFSILARIPPNIGYPYLANLAEEVSESQKIAYPVKDITG
jgi:hypothetical protein